jgi:transcriptional regulator of acetoin/glycerol metabolism
VSPAELPAVDHHRVLDFLEMPRVQTDAELRPEIRRSWDRSIGSGLDRGSELDLPFDPGVRGNEEYLRAALPVMKELENTLAGSRTGLILTDAKGRLLLRQCAERSHAKHFDASRGTPGFSWSEKHTGTTAIGLALEERLPALVTAEEHYLEALSHWVCAAAPVVHPVTRKLQGVIDATTDRAHASPQTMSIALQAAGMIQEGLYEGASKNERALLSHFLSLSNRSPHPVIVLGNKLELSTAPAARLLDTADRTLLWEHAALALKREKVDRQTLTLTGGTEITAAFNPVECDGRAVGVAVEVVSTAPDPACLLSNFADVANTPKRVAGRSEPDVEGAGGFIGRSTVSRDLRAQVQRLQEELVPVLITGEAGVGKLTLARELAGDDMECVLFDAARIAVDGGGGLLREMAALAESAGKTIIVRRIGCIPAAAQQVLASIASRAEANSSRLVATTVSEGPGSTTPDVGAFGLRIEIPPLRERADDMVDLVPSLVRRRDCSKRVSPVVIQALMRYDWPGNVRELDALIRMLLIRHRASEIGFADLPFQYRGESRRLKGIERSERAAISRELIEADGNKSRAALRLGISRATLYRKIRAYGLDPNSVHLG